MSLVLRVEAVEKVSDRIRILELVDPSGLDLPPWTPGAHINLTLPTGHVRQYSLCSDPDDRTTYRIAVLRVDSPKGRGGSQWIHDGVTVGQLLEVGGPRNTFPVPDASEYVLLAGGIGITPLAAMARMLSRQGADWRIVYGARTRQDMVLADEMTALAPGRVALVPQDECGLVALDDILEYKPGLAVLCCGPEPMLAAVAERCADWPAGSLHTERFEATSASATPSDDRAFTVKLARRGIRLRVGADQTLLDAMREGGLDIPFSCREGICGTCETAVLSGRVDHRDHYLTEEERAAHDTMMPCVSRAASDQIVLDL